MNSSEIRRIDISEAKCGSGPRDELLVLLQREIAAQLADINEGIRLLVPYHPSEQDEHEGIPF